MKDAKKRKRTPKPLTKGALNKLIDDLVHPLFSESKGFIFVDGLLHGLVEQNLPLSVKKFVKYNFPELMKEKKSRRGMPRGKKRSYTCMLPVNGRFITCKHKKAGPWCLKVGVLKSKCPKLVVSYK